MRTISIQKPYSINLSGKTITALESNIVTWQTSGAQQWEREVVIQDNSTNLTVFTLAREQSTSNKYTLPAGTLTNNKTYKITIQVWGVDGEGAISDPALFYVYSRPTVELVNFPNTVGSNAIDVNFTYSVDEAQGNEMRDWNLLLYDSADNLIYSTGPQLTPQLHHLITNLVNGAEYHIQIRATSARSIVGQTVKTPFTVQYGEQPYDTSIQALPIPNAGVEVKWNVLQVSGEGENYSFINDSRVDVTEGKVWFDKGYKIDGDFAIRMTLEQVHNEEFIHKPNIKIYKYNSTEGLGEEVELEDLLLVDPLLQILAPKPLSIVASYTKPSPTTYPGDQFLWIQDPMLIGQGPRVYSLDRTGKDPGPTKLWFAEDFNVEKSVIAQFEEDHRTVTIQRYNNNFVMSFSNTTTTYQLPISGDRFCLILKRESGMWYMEGEGYNE